MAAYAVLSLWSSEQAQQLFNFAVAVRNPALASAVTQNRPTNIDKPGGGGGYYQVKRNSLFFGVKPILVNTTNQRLSWHVDQRNLQDIS